MEPTLDWALSLKVKVCVSIYTRQIAPNTDGESTDPANFSDKSEATVSKTTKVATSMSIFGDGRISTHADPMRGQRAGRIDKRTGHPYDQAPHELHTRVYPIFGFWASKYPQNGDFLPRTPMNHRAKFDAAWFILGGEIRNRTNKHA